MAALIEDGKVSMYEAHQHLPSQDAAPDGARDETLQRCFAELIAALGDAKKIRSAIRASRISK